ncbi:class II aldolase/adducin family protein [Oxalobacteraceae bacterium CAVE-383]|nr:class II aldolase/adducin family protein [Oxalobacteraceae bacterium CAVE-383]
MTLDPVVLDDAAIFKAKQDLIDAGLILEAEGLGDLTRGHVSIRMPGNPSLFIMKPHSYGFDEITMDNIVTCDMEGNKIGTGGRRHSEVFIHTEIYKARPDVNSVIHVHPTHAVALSATGRPLRPISQPASCFNDGLPYFTETIELIRTREMGVGVAKALGPHKAVLMRNHGVAVVGAMVEESVILTILLESACQIQLLAESGGGIGEEFANSYVDRLHETIIKPEQYTVNFEFLRRKVRRAKN